MIISFRTFEKLIEESEDKFERDCFVSNYSASMLCALTYNMHKQKSTAALKAKDFMPAMRNRKKDDGIDVVTKAQRMFANLKSQQE